MLNPGNEEMRKVYVDTLIAMADQGKDIVVMEADLSGSIGTKKFQEKYPDRYINCGIMEAQMVGAAAGMSLRGRHPFIHTFASFASRRVFDQVFISLAYAGLSATILGSDCGVTAEFNGGTHMPFEDIGLMRVLYNCNVVEATDEIMFKALLEMSQAQGGLWYIRTSRKKAPRLYEAGETFRLGEGKVVKEGKDVCIMAYGISVAESVEAAEILKSKGIDAAVVDMFSINPLDKAMVRRYLDSAKGIITVENHSVINGLGSAVAEVIAESGKATKFARLGVINQYGQTGSLDYLKKVYGIDKEAIAAKVMEML